jgi:DNA-binding PadR family transcriptional regulator
MRFGIHHGRHEHGHGCGGRHGGPRGGGWGRGGFRPGGFGGWGGMPEGDPRGGGRGGRRRMFDGSELRLVLLKLIEESPRHGYDLIREIEERTSGIYAPSPGVIYPTLTMLDDMGLIEEQKREGAKKQFAITPAGTAHLDERREEVDALFARLAALGDLAQRTTGGPVRRAMGNLRSALQEKLADSEVDPETLHQVAAILDDATQRIERL